MTAPKAAAAALLPGGGARPAPRAAGCAAAQDPSHWRNWRWLTALFVLAGSAVAAAKTGAAADDRPQLARKLAASDGPAALLVQRTIQRLALGDAFDAKLRQRIWVGGREVVGIGHYEQSGGGTGRFSLEMTIHDGDTRQSTRQISDGKLAWTRTQLGESVMLRRVDLGRIDEVCREAARLATSASTHHRGVAHAAAAEEPVPAWMKVGGLVELIDQIATDFDLRVGKGTIGRQPVFFLRGTLSEEARKRIEETGGRTAATPLCPYEVQLAISAVGDANGFGVGLPVQIEFYNQPQPEAPLEPQVLGDPGDPGDPGNHGEPAAPAATVGPSDAVAQPPVAAPRSGDGPRGRLISLLEIYALRQIRPSPEERFRYKGDDPDVALSNDTRRYLERLVPHAAGSL